MEIWKDIKGYEGLYQISNFGSVRDSKRNKYRKVSMNCRGYAWISLTKDKKQKPFSVHRLVAIHFIPNPDNLPQVNHKNLNRMDNVVTNLEWCDQSYNVRHADLMRGGTRASRPAFALDKNPRAKKVMNENTGEIFECAATAAINLGIKPKYFQRMLRGVRKNETGFKYI